MGANLLKKRITGERLKYLQSLPLEQKESLAKMRIQQFYRAKMNKKDYGKIYVSFSGGKDSTVLLHLVRSVYPDAQAVFVDTGLEFPEIREFVKTVENVIWLKPKIPFTKVLEKYGYPVVSKEVSRFVQDLQNPTDRNERTRRIRLEGSEFKGGKSSTGMLSKKWQFLKDAPFKVSGQCCDVMKKSPVKRYERETGNRPIIGTMAGESRLRKQSYMSGGCNIFKEGRNQSRPLSVWKEEDIWSYIKKYNIGYSKIYDMGYERTGCVFCMFGYWNELTRGKDRFAQLKKTHPKLNSYCMNNLGMEEIIDYINNKLNHGQLDLFRGENNEREN